ncbi:NAD(P)/FAD-dependent oxidoreductase [Cryobacterium sp.]|uniref:phytoene desaturase family protein n=1 Tax=Cryobacterium sp. TaxID=1926290 RepID=UPI0026057B12|nr:NAD(P)/FAD-dependent oxidoreductase [Cryobacterium sp.]MCU1444673.1 dependent oxidoreductase [Cryobacterium sp.]
METTADIVIVGGGHNGLTAAAYLARAGKSVLLLERDDHVGGAAVSATAFAGVDARLSRYSYLVSLLPARIIDELGLDIALARRRYSSYTPDPADPTHGLLVDSGDADATRASFERIGAGGDIDAWVALSTDLSRLAQALFPSVCEPLPTRCEARRLLGDNELWAELIERPLGDLLTRRFGNDVVRGIVATDGLIGTFTSVHDASLGANVCFLYHSIGNGTGDWDVPLGGMGALTGELERVARGAGARILTGAEVTGISPDGSVRYRVGADEQTVTGGYVLANVAPWVLQGLLGDPPGEKPEGAQVKVNLLLSRLPRLRDATVSPEAAFGGTFHINETLSQLETAYDEAKAGRIPGTLACEIYCHSLTDPSILSPDLIVAGAHTLTVFGLHTPDRLARPDNTATRAALQAAVLASLNSVLAEPVESLLMTDAAGAPCIETKTTADLEDALNLPGGDIFHGRLSWPFLEDDEAVRTPAERWGVATAHPRILLCGAAARRGGGVSGIGGHNAAMAVLEAE